MPLIRHPKRRGEWVELQFMARAASHGLTISKPWGDSGRYDFIVEYKGRFSRVQVKSTVQAVKTKPNRTPGAYLCNTVSRSGSLKDKGRLYTTAEVDFFAFFIIPEDIWYIVPLTEMRRTKWAAFLNPHCRTNRYFRYMEAWGLLRRGSI